ncbi:MAG: hypothetical protein U5R31_08285 [Acidimicrobiia bacterium]|nr:hypothetical protein [Acidimicrobiia bacterium]
MSAAQRLAARTACRRSRCRAGPGPRRRRSDFVGRGDTKLIVKGDAACPSIAAASILAKVTRDRLMRREAEHFPGYDFDRNKGYRARCHKIVLRGMGPTAIHSSQLGVHGPPALAGVPRSARPTPSSACSRPSERNDDGAVEVSPVRHGRQGRLGHLQALSHGPAGQAPEEPGGGGDVGGMGVAAWIAIIFGNLLILFLCVLPAVALVLIVLVAMFTPLEPARAEEAPDGPEVHGPSGQGDT